MRTFQSRRPVVRSIPAPVIHVERATFIPTGMHGVREEQYVNEGWRTATLIPTGMHSDFRAVRGHSPIERALIAKGIHPERARALVARATRRVRSRRPRSAGMHGLGDVVSDAMTWVTYGNEILQRSKTGNVSEEALRAAQNINTFLGNRGSELDVASPTTVDAIGEMADKLTKLGVGTIRYDSAAGAFFDEFGNAIRGEVIVGAKAVAAAPGKIVKYAVDEVVKPALDVVPWYVWAGVAVTGSAIAGKALHLW